MGIFDYKMNTYKVAETVSIEDLHKFFEDVLGSKYKIKLERKGKNAVASAFKGVSQDQIFIAKNGYHRTVVVPVHANNETHFRLDESTISPWLTFLSRQTGLIGAGIIRLVYGNGKEFYGDVINVLRDKLNVEEGQQNVGISRLWKKEDKK